MEKPDNDGKQPEQVKEGALCPKCKTRIDKESRLCPQCNTIVFTDNTGLVERLRRIESYSLCQMLIHEREYLFESIYKHEKLLHKICYCLLYTLLFCAIYGAVIGSHAGVREALSMAVKVPLTFGATLLVCLALLFCFNVSTGVRLSLLQTLTIMLLSNYQMGIALLSLTPVLGMFIVYSESLAFLHMLNLLFIVIAGALGIGLLWEGMEYFAAKAYREIKTVIICTWSVVYVFVFLQAAWTLKLFGDLTQLPIFKQLNIEGDFYTALFELIKKAMSSGD